MSTKDSPRSKLKAEANRVAVMLKKAERGEDLGDPTHTARMREARRKDSVIVGVVMDDKILKIDFRWETIRSHSELSLTEFTLKAMMEDRGH